MSKPTQERVKRSERDEEVNKLVSQARWENRLVVRAKQRFKRNGFIDDLQQLVMPRFVRNNLMSAARRLRAE